MPKINVLRRGRSVFALLGLVSHPVHELSHRRVLCSSLPFGLDLLGLLVGNRTVDNIALTFTTHEQGTEQRGGRPRPPGDSYSRLLFVSGAPLGASPASEGRGRSFLSRHIEQVRREEHVENALPP